MQLFMQNSSVRTDAVKSAESSSKPSPMAPLKVAHAPDLGELGDLFRMYNFCV